MSRLVIFQNYFTPYRHRLFVEIAKHRELLVIYLHLPQDENRKWKKPEKIVEYSVIQISGRKVGPLIMFDIKPLTEELKNTDSTVFLDNMPTNLSMIALLNSPQLVVPYYKRYLWVEHTLDLVGDNAFKTLARRMFTQSLVEKTSRYLAFSEKTSSYLKDAGARRADAIIRVPQAVYTSEQIEQIHVKANMSKKPQNKTVFGFLGYFNSRKGIPLLLRAISKIANKNIELLFAGDGLLKKEIALAAEEDTRITLLDYINTEEQKTTFFSKIHYFVVPSEKEPWGLVVNEAATRGVPVIASDAIGANELVHKIWEHGIFKRNSVMGLVSNMEYAIRIHEADPHRYQELVDKSFSVAKEYSIEGAAQVFLNLE